MNATDYRNAFAAAVTAHGFSVTAEQIADIADAVWSAAQLMAQDEATFRAALVAGPATLIRELAELAV